jgi:Haem-degrading
MAVRLRCRVSLPRSPPESRSRDEPFHRDGWIYEEKHTEQASFPVDGCRRTLYIPAPANPWSSTLCLGGAGCLSARMLRLSRVCSLRLEDGSAPQATANHPIRQKGNPMSVQRWLIPVTISLWISMVACPAFADSDDAACSALPSQAALQTALDGAVGVAGNGGLGFNMWASLVANDGTVCAVAFSGKQYTDQWLGSRVISAQKANTANSFSLGEGSHIPAGSLFRNGLALSTANLYSAVQPGGSLYGLQHSNPVDPDVAYKGPASSFGTAHDPLVGDRVGGVNVFGGGLVLLSKGGNKVGGVGVSGDTSCTDHMVAWRVRHTLNLDHFGPAGAPVGGVAGLSYPDNIVFDIAPTPDGGMLNPVGNLSKSLGGFGHPTCLNPPNLGTLPAVQYD